MMEKIANSDGGLLVHIVLISMSLCILAIGWVIHAAMNIKSSDIVTGKVVEIVETKHYRNDSPTFAPRIAYLNSNGDRNSLVSSTWCSHSFYKVGDQVKLAITKDGPPIILTAWEAFGVQIIIASLLTTVFVGSVLYLACIRFIEGLML